MNFILLICYDALAALILLLAINKSARLGFAQTIVGLLGQICSFFGALFLGKAGSRLIYQLFLGKRVLRFLEESLGDAVSANDIISSLSETADSLPTFLANFYGLSDDALQNSIGSTVRDAVQLLEEQVVEPAVTGFLHIVIFLIAFAVFSLLARHLAKAVGLMFKLPIIKTVDRFCGALLGILQGGINLYLLALLARLVLYFVNDPPGFFNERLIMDTLIWSRIYEFNPFTFLK